MSESIGPKSPNVSPTSSDEGVDKDKEGKSQLTFPKLDINLRAGGAASQAIKQQQRQSAEEKLDAWCNKVKEGSPEYVERTKVRDSLLETHRTGDKAFYVQKYKHITDLCLPPELGIDTLRISDCAHLRSVDVPSGVKGVVVDNCREMDSINLAPDSKLQSMSVRKCPKVASLDLAKCPNLENLSVDECSKLVAMDPSGCPELRKFNITQCLEWSLSKPLNHKNLNSLSLCNCHKMSSLDFSKCPELRVIDLHRNSGLSSVVVPPSATRVEISGCPKLPSLNLRGRYRKPDH